MHYAAYSKYEFLRYFLFYTYLSCLLPCTSLRLWAGLQAVGSHSANPPPEEQSDRLPLLGLPTKFAPIGVVSFYLNNDLRRLPSGIRLAVLGTREFVILKLDAHKLVSEFSLSRQGDDFSNWEEIESFPCPESPGIILWAGGVATREESTVICSVSGHFKVVYAGESATPMDINGDGIAEIVSEADAGESNKQPEWVRIWKWDHEKYVMILPRIRNGELFSEYVKKLVSASTEKRTDAATIPNSTR